MFGRDFISMLSWSSLWTRTSETPFLSVRGPQISGPFTRKCYIETQTHTYVLQNAPPRVKPVHVDDDKEEVDECGDGHEERQLPDESGHQVKGLLLLRKGSDGGNDQLVPFLNLGSWKNNIWREECNQNCQENVYQLSTLYDIYILLVTMRGMSKRRFVAKWRRTITIVSLKTDHHRFLYSTLVKLFPEINQFYNGYFGSKSSLWKITRIIVPVRKCIWEVQNLSHML